MASCSLLSSRPTKYQVFLSFRGKDTRLNFTSHLRKALKDNGISVFSDETELERGEELISQLSRAIAASNLSIIVLSKDYASSNLCLAELSDIMHRNRTEGHIVLPIFYHVDPSDVQNVDKSFKISFSKHESTLEVNRWRTAFVDVSKLQGCHISGGENDKPETEHIKHIVEYVIAKLLKHHVFLSFGKSTSISFTNHLHKALIQRGINVFFDNETLDHKAQAIATSDLSVIILSGDYASSESCLAEVSDIMRRRKETQRHIVLPIFYDVDPSDVWHCSGSFKTSFQEHEHSKRPVDEVERWKTAFSDVGKLKGWHIKGGKSDRSETECIEDIVEHVIKKLNNKYTSVSQRLDGIEEQEKTILELIQKKKIIIGLWGMGGIGKTTLAEAVYNEIALNFDRHCFVQNVREKIVD